jgi:Cytochrome b5-like Heme/Steroid binding domain
MFCHNGRHCHSLFLYQHNRKAIIPTRLGSLPKMASSTPSTTTPSPSSSSLITTYQQVCDLHNDSSPFLVIVDSYVLDLSQFIEHHPGSAKKIRHKRRELGTTPDISRNFLDHFSFTVQTFRQACRDFDAQQQPVTFRFMEGTNRTVATEANVVIVGKIESK